MAKKKEPRKAPLVQLPLAISPLEGNDDLSNITRGINGGLLNSQQSSSADEVEKTEEVEDKTRKRGRPQKQSLDIVEAKGETDWDKFLDYTSQYYKTKKTGIPVIISDELVKFFYGLKIVVDQKVDINSMINATVKLFMDKNKDRVNELLVRQMTDNK